MQILDKDGDPIPSKEVRDEAEKTLPAFLAKHKAAIQHWFNEHGAFTRPPIKYDVQKKEWFWSDRP